MLMVRFTREAIRAGIMIIADQQRIVDNEKLRKKVKSDIFELLYVERDMTNKKGEVRRYHR